jgi:hypothetical protein
VFTDAGFRALIQKMDDADVPFDNRAFVIPPSLRNAIMGIDRYVSSDFVSGQPVQNGKIGNLYGIDVYVSTNCATSEAAADNSANTNDLKAALLIHKDTLCWQSKWVFVRRHSTSKSSLLTCTLQISSTA